jgi:hypothetical protein
MDCCYSKYPLALHLRSAARCESIEPELLATRGTLTNPLATGLACRLIVEDIYGAKAFALAS